MYRIDQCFSTGVPRHSTVPRKFSCVPPNHEIQQKVSINSTISVFLGVLRICYYQKMPKKVEKHWNRQRGLQISVMRLKINDSIVTFFPSIYWIYLPIQYYITKTMKMSHSSSSFSCLDLPSALYFKYNSVSSTSKILELRVLRILLCML